MFRMEYALTDGRVIFDGAVHDRQAKKRADYVLFERANYPIAIVEAKDNNRPLGVVCSKQWNMQKCWM